MSVKLNCLFCGKEFETTPVKAKSRKYCSSECAKAGQWGERGTSWKGGPVTCKCLACGKEFSVPKSQIAAGRKYCSCACSATVNSGSNHGRWKGGLASRTCQGCGKEFSTKPKQIRRGYGNFCSRSCASLNTAQQRPKTTITKYCVVCGKSIEVKKSHADTGGKYCSRECVSSDYRNRMCGIENPNYRHGNFPFGKAGGVRRARMKSNGGKHTKKDITFLLRQQRGECAHCGEKLGKFEVDHIIPVSRGGSDYVGNLQLLCRACNIHKHGKLTIEWKYEHILKARKYQESLARKRVKKPAPAPTGEDPTN